MFFLSGYSQKTGFEEGGMMAFNEKLETKQAGGAYRSGVRK